LSKKGVSAKEYRAIIDEILSCKKTLEGYLGEYGLNAIDRLILARIKLENSTIKEASG